MKKQVLFFNFLVFSLFPMSFGPFPFGMQPLPRLVFRDAGHPESIPFRLCGNNHGPIS